MSERHLFVFDAESVGLHGDVFAVGGGVYGKDGTALWEFRFACPITRFMRGSPEDLGWVRAHVPPMAHTHASMRGLRDGFWQQWEAARNLPGLIAAAECGWPVEARLLEQCVQDAPGQRSMRGPYPLHDVASFLLAAGIDPMITFDREPQELPKHDPLADARQSARLLVMALNMTASRTW